MVKNNLAKRRVRRSLSIGLVLFFLWLFVCPSFAYTYSNDYPVYLTFVGAKYVEVESATLGRGSLVLSANVQDSYISIGINNNNLYNNTSSTLYGVFRTINGNDYSVRFQAFSTAEYYVSGSYNPTYTQLNVTQIYNTNIKFVDYNDTNKQNDTFIISDNVERFNICLSFLNSFVLLIFLVLFLFKRSEI